jgi:catechol 2,3-dioxygenase-like lactoylglutathione lyase family enzyme
MRVEITSVLVYDQDQALDFYTNVLGFVKRDDIPLGEGYRWITVASPEKPDGTLISIEPCATPWAKAYKEGAMADGVALLFLTVDDLQAEYERLLALGVRFTVPPTDSPPIKMAVLDDTNGNLVMLGQMTDSPPTPMI